MKIGLILKAGYRLIRYKDKTVIKSNIDEEHGVINIEFRETGRPPWDDQHAGSYTTSISLELDHEALDLKFRMFVDFNEETANALLLGDVAPLLKEDIFTYEAAKEALKPKITKTPSRNATSLKNMFGSKPSGLN